MQLLVGAFMESSFRTACILLMAAALFSACGKDTGAPLDANMEAGDVRVAADVSIPGADQDVGGQILPCDDRACDCMIGPAGGSCVTQYCVLTVDAGALERERFFSLNQATIVGEPGAELFGRRACALESTATPDDLAGPYELAIRYDESDIPDDFTEDEVVGVIAVEAPTLAGGALLDVQRNRVSLGLMEPTTLGVSVLPRRVEVTAEIGLDEFQTLGPVDYVRNLSRNVFGAVFHDGRRLYVGNGPRLLIWANGVPDDPNTLPDVVLGRPDLTTNSPFTSASSFSGTINAIWSDGTRLAVAEGNRVLIWNLVPTESFYPADLVLGQDDFTSNSINKNGPVGSDTMRAPAAIASDGQRFAVADALNHRVLLWEAFPTVSSAPADYVLGQQDLDNAVVGGGATPLFQAWGAYFDGTRLAVTSAYGCNCVNVLSGFPQTTNLPATYTVGATYASRVTDIDFSRPASVSGFGGGGLALHNGYRVSVWRSFPTAARPADFTLGKPDPTVSEVFGRMTASSFSTLALGASMFADGERVLVADGRRVLVWSSLPDASFTAADKVIGQPSAATSLADIDYRGISDSTLAEPTSVSSAGAVTVIADRANNRVLVLRGDPTRPTSTVVLGQRSASDFIGQPTSAGSLKIPAGVFTDGSRIIVADSGNHRVLVWNSIPTTHGAPADIVLGQDDFVSGAQNGGNADVDGDGDIDANGSSLHYPSGVSAVGSAIAVADTYNNRVMIWDGPIANGLAATRTLGQPDGVSNDPNHGSGWWVRGADSLARPTDVSMLIDGTVAVADSENNRVLLFAPGQTSAGVVLGQPDATSDVSPNWLTGFNTGWPINEASKVADATTLRWPYGIDIRDDALVVADTGNHRVLQYSGPFTTGMAADVVLGQSSFTTRGANAMGVSGTGLNGAEDATFSDSGLLVADSDNHRILSHSTAGGATGVFGQTTLLRNGINASSPAWDRLNRPGGMHVAPDGVVWIADRGHHRVAAFANDKLGRVLGQVDRGGAQRNAGQSMAAGWTMSQPSDLWTDGEVMVVADRDNHRVLIWNEIPEDPTTPANVIIGQSDPASTGPNAGLGVSGASASTLFAPDGVTVDDGRLYIADSGNNRVLVFNSVPTTPGASADGVLCQPDMNANRVNRGRPQPGADTCAGPTDVLIVEGTIWIADSLNHRVLRFDDVGSPAALVIGQADFETRRPLTTDNEVSAAIFHDPSRLAFDGGGLFVVDRGNHRVLIYDRVPKFSGQPADRVLGQVGVDTAVVTPRVDGLHSPSGIFVLPDSYHRTHVWVTDAGKNRAVQFSRVARAF